jgi:hypothetical protein
VVFGKLLGLTATEGLMLGLFVGNLHEFSLQCNPSRLEDESHSESEARTIRERCVMRRTPVINRFADCCWNGGSSTIHLGGGPGSTGANTFIPTRSGDTGGRALSERNVLHERTGP